MSYKIKAQEFLKIAEDFKLGELPTERSHEQTRDLSEWSKNNLPLALETIKQIDLDLFDTAISEYAGISQMRDHIYETFKDGGKVFLCGCGATGRLSLALEAIWKKSKNISKGTSVLSFMAGGDVALVHSIENFEDYPEYGERQLRELGFSSNDLLISCTEGGETPFVIGATEEATRISKRSPYFLYCNPDDVLEKNVERSRDVINNSKIKKVNLSTGPMVLAGSTRMQASTILMLAVGIALFDHSKEWLEDLKKKLSQLDFGILKDLIIEESKIYEQGETIIYRTNESLGISVLTDTTERSPTFSLHPFEAPAKNSIKTNHGDELPYSLCYLTLANSTGIENSWNSLLGRKPRTLEWEDTKHLSGIDRLNEFDISSDILERRKSYINTQDHLFDVSTNKEEQLFFTIGKIKKNIDISGLDLFGIHIILKILLNTHSTLVMGRLDRYESNIMTWVRPSNNKLIDRTIRYIAILLEKESRTYSYEDICFELFSQMENSTKGESLVLKTTLSLKNI